MAKHITPEHIASVEPRGDVGSAPSPERIKQLALERRGGVNESTNGKEETTMKKGLFRVFVIAAVICAMSVTVFAATGGLEYFRSIFGDSAGTLQNEIVAPQATASADGRELALEALLTDGYVTNLVVSLTGGRVDEDDLFSLSGSTEFSSYGWYVMEEFTSRDKTCYMVELVSEGRFDAADVTLSLNPEIAPIDLAFSIENRLGNAVVRFPEGAVSGETALRELQVSSMGFLLIGYESDARGGLPGTHMRLVFSDGREELLEVEFAPSEVTVGGGGGAIMTDNPADMPLVGTFHGTRNPDGELVVSGQFSRIINPADIEKVIVGGVEYPVK